VLNSILLDKIIDELTGDICTITLVQDQGVVVVSAESFLLVHPIIDTDINDVETVLSEMKKGGLTCSFTTDHSDMKSAVETLGAVTKQNKTIVFKTTKEKVVVQGGDEGSSGLYRLKPTEIKAKEESKFGVTHEYIAEFVKAAPQTVPITVEIWGDRYIHIVPQVEGTTIDYGTMSLEE
jgi:hypothetical protein